MHIYLPLLSQDYFLIMFSLNIFSLNLLCFVFVNGTKMRQRKWKSESALEVRPSKEINDKADGYIWILKPFYFLFRAHLFILSLWFTQQEAWSPKAIKAGLFAFTLQKANPYDLQGEDPGAKSPRELMCLLQREACERRHMNAVWQ